ncbi:protein POLLENLESS 3-LIKE 2-like [Malania oleifera]|uniref:protein POLLENLESS 3-LIKE 2-like n=1 Tax=Malania oleifera TaxID=397392 RepID=UPI0025ADEDF6|nr:protein POLLENLESS 3-LIKE 2-like [Malania oleifera]
MRNAPSPRSRHYKSHDNMRSDPRPPRLSHNSSSAKSPPRMLRSRSQFFHVGPNVPVGNSTYAVAKKVQMVDKDPEKTIPLLWAAINAGDRVDSALKDMAIAMKQQNRAEEAIEAIKSLRYRCSDEAQESLDNILLDLYKACGRLDDQIALLRHKLDLLYQGKAFNGKPTKIARSRGKRLQISVDQEIIRLQGNLGWALMQQKKCLEAEVAYRQAIFLAPNNNNQMCNLAMCLMKQGKIAAAKKTLQQVNPTVAGLDSPLRSFQSAQQLLEDIESGRETLPPPPPRWQQHTLEEEKHGILILMLDIFTGLKRLHQ